MLFLNLLLEIVAFPKRNDNIMEMYQTDLETTASGSIGQWVNGKCQKTDPLHVTDTVERKTDWCSNINRSKKDYPWLSVNLKGKSIALTGYSLRSGCCYYGCCCDDGAYVRCCCEIYSWSLQASHDNKTWETIHKVEKDSKFYACQNRSYDVKSSPFEFYRIIQDEPWPGCDFCMCINKFELYGQVGNSKFVLTNNDEEEEDSISIIGKINRENIE